MITKARYRSQLIHKTVNSYFRMYPNETYTGLVRVCEVVDVVFNTLIEYGFRWTVSARGEALDQIRLLGPEGEDDLRWLYSYGGSMTAIRSASINEWGLLDSTQERMLA